MALDNLKETFLQECTELLSEMEAALLQIEQDPENHDLLNAIFRAAHTIKGSSGLFGYDNIVAFTHVAENVLDRLRDGDIAISGELVALLLESRDFISTLVDAVVTEQALTAESEAKGAELKASLAGYLGEQAPKVQDVQELQKSEDDRLVRREGQYVSNDNWHISLRLNEEVLAFGMDPISFIQYLSRLGEITHITTITDKLPGLDAIDPEKCYLGFEIDLDADTSKEEIESTFEFVKDDCTLRILPPQASLEKYLEFINEVELPELKIGEILVKGKALTEAELQQALNIQNNPTSQSRAETEKVPLGEVLVQEKMVRPEVVNAAVKKQQNLRTGQPSKSIRVDADKLDHLINLIGEMVIAGAGAAMHTYATGNAALIESFSGLNMLVEEVRDSALRLRMVQIADTFNRFQRVVRDVSKELNKKIRLEISGGETELDKTVVEKIGDPLMHLVRNSMDHGLEPAQVRVSKGKPETGTIKLNAYHDSGSVVIEVSDDGAGLNRERILKKAQEKGLVSVEATLSDQEVFNLIFEPGFSTAEKVTNLSGRGVGMDVVRKNIESMRGMVEVFSHAGLGTTFKIRLPLTLAIIDGFHVGVENSSFVIPLEMVLECVELNAYRGNVDEDKNYINLRGEVLPFVRLRDLFGLKGGGKSRENIVVVQYGTHKAGLLVDQLFGELQTVIKPLGAIFSHVKGVSGSTILGNGVVALIIDVPGLVQEVTEHESKAAISAA